MRRRTTTRRERGAALVEAAAVIPFLVVLAVGLAEIGFAVVDRLTAANASREGARVAAAAGAVVDADLSILRSVEQAMCALHYGDLKSVEIYNADPAGAPVDPTNELNEYTPSGALNCTNSATTNLTCNNGCPWVSTSRGDTVVNLDEVGVRVTYTHNWVTGLLPLPTADWVDVTVMRIEPDTGT